MLTYRENSELIRTLDVNPTAATNYSKIIHNF